MNTLLIERRAEVRTLVLNRPHARNAVDGPTSHALAQALREFDADAQARVAILIGAGGQFCAGADLKAVAVGFGANPLALDLILTGRAVGARIGNSNTIFSPKAPAAMLLNTH